MSYCGQCGAKNRKGNRFCEQCGVALSQSAAFQRSPAKQQVAAHTGPKGGDKRVALVVALIIFVAVGVALNYSGTLNPAQRHIKLGYKLLGDGVYDEAILAFEQAINMEPRSVPARIGLAEGCLKTGELERAETVLEEALQIDCNNTAACILLADVKVELGDTQSAIALLEAASAKTDSAQLKEKLDFLNGLRWVYYIGDNNTLYRVKTDGTEKTRIVDCAVWAFTMSGEWVYYVEQQQDMKLYRVRSDGTGSSQLLDNQVGNLAAAKGWVYYVRISRPGMTGADNLKGVYKIASDGSGKMKLSSDIPEAWSFKVSGDKVFYRAGGFAYSIGTDGTDRTRLTNYSVWPSAGGWMYSADGKRIYRSKPNGTAKTVLVQTGAAASGLTLHGDYLFYINVNDGMRVYRVHKDGTGATRVTADSPSSLGAGDWFCIGIAGTGG